MIRSLLLLSTLILSTATFAQAERTSPENIFDQKVAGVFKGRPSGFLINREVETCTVSFKYDHEEKYGDITLLYYKVKVDFPELDYDSNFLLPEDFEFLVSRDYLLNFYPKNFVLQAYADHRNDYKAIRLKFGSNGKLSAVQTSYGLTGAPTSTPGWSWFSAYTCKLQ
jgi:hypothetical protein